MDYKQQCLCGSKDFSTINLKNDGIYRSFRACKKCGTLKMWDVYYNDDKKQYGNS